jgi:hypothetical protein
MADKPKVGTVSLDNPEVKQKHRLAAGLKVDGQSLPKPPKYSKPNV